MPGKAEQELEQMIFKPLHRGEEMFTGEPVSGIHRRGNSLKRWAPGKLVPTVERPALKVNDFRILIL